MSVIPLPIDLAREIDRLLHCAETTPLIGGDAMHARLALREIDPAAFTAPRIEVACEACGAPVPFGQQLSAAHVGESARYCSPRCRETARKRRQRAKAVR